MNLKEALELIKEGKLIKLNKFKNYAIGAVTFDNYLYTFKFKNGKYISDKVFITDIKDIKSKFWKSVDIDKSLIIEKKKNLKKNSKLNVIQI